MIVARIGSRRLATSRFLAVVWVSGAMANSYTAIRYAAMPSWWFVGYLTRTRLRRRLMRESMTGILGCSRLIPQRRVTKKHGLLGTLFLDMAKPLPPSDIFYVTNGLEGDGAEQWTLRGKGAAQLRYEDKGRPVKVVGEFRPNPSYASIGKPRRLGTLTRLQVEFLDEQTGDQS